MTTAPSASLSCAAASRGFYYAAPGGNDNTSIQMTTDQDGWAVLGHNILATTDGHDWNVQARSPEPLIFVDAVDRTHAWVVGASSMLGTTDGYSWHRLGEPPAPLLMVHFTSASTGWGVAKGALYETVDGGRSWMLERAPCTERVCFTNSSNGWIGARNRVFQTSDAGLHWREVLAAPDAQRWHASDLQCTTGNDAWVYMTGEGAASGSMAHTAYHCTPTGNCTEVAVPGSYPGPMSAIDDHTAAFVGYTPPATISMDLAFATDDGRRLSNALPIPGPAQLGFPGGASFRDESLGWVVATLNTREAILVTADGGETWRDQYHQPNR
jgi:photosystem II stability/assembly factor-like uncharacterized protein